MEKITGIKLIDNEIEKRGLIWWIKLGGKYFIIMGILDVITIITLPVWKEKFFTQWSDANLPMWIPAYGAYKTVILAPLKIITGVSMLKLKYLGWALMIGIGIYNIFELLFYLDIEFLIVFPSASYAAFYKYNHLFWFTLGICAASLYIYIITRKKVKEQFEK